MSFDWGVFLAGSVGLLALLGLGVGAVALIFR
jgi:hypothetical protein